MSAAGTRERGECGIFQCPLANWTHSDLSCVPRIVYARRHVRGAWQDVLLADGCVTRREAEDKNAVGRCGGSATKAYQRVFFLEVSSTVGDKVFGTKASKYLETLLGKAKQRGRMVFAVERTLTVLKVLGLCRRVCSGSRRASLGIRQRFVTCLCIRWCGWSPGVYVHVVRIVSMEEQVFKVSGCSEKVNVGPQLSMWLDTDKTLRVLQVLERVLSALCKGMRGMPRRLY